MDEFENVLCFCPSSRLSLTSLVLSTWTSVRRFTLTDREDIDLGGFDAVIVMDGFVTNARVKRLAARLPVLVLAWNGMFEISGYRVELGDLDVTYVGTDDTAPDVRYAPMIDGRAEYTRWRELYLGKHQFRVVGSAAYRMRWLRARVLPSRIASVVIAAAGAARKPRVLRKTVASGYVSERLVWAGNCYLDAQSIGLAPEEQRVLEARVATVRAEQNADARLRACLALIAEWRTTIAPTLGAERAHQAYYVTNTLLRWAVLGYLSATAPRSTWFFGRDNLGLGLAMELYVHNLVPAERVAFLEFGGKTAESGLYPRSLHLLAKQFYVIGFPPAEDTSAVARLIDLIHEGLRREPSAWFDALERRRRELYAGIPATESLRDVQQRVWTDFPGLET